MKQNIVFLASTLLIFFMVNSAYSQRKRNTETVYLKTGNIISGEIIEYHRYEHVKVKLTPDFEVIVPFEEISKISTRKHSVEKILINHKGFASVIEAGINVGRAGVGEDIVKTLSLHAVNGYQFSKFMVVGIGVGYDNLQPNYVLPLYISFRGDLNKQKISPTYQADIGYGFMGGPNKDVLEGGIYFHPGLGYKFYLGSIALGLNAGYKIQKSKYSLIFPDYEMIEKRTYNRFTLRTSIYF